VIKAKTNLGIMKNLYTLIVIDLSLILDEKCSIIYFLTGEVSSNIAISYKVATMNGYKQK
jgi:hypothetical protein